jgi:hypothetical protein
MRKNRGGKQREEEKDEEASRGGKQRDEEKDEGEAEEASNERR